VPIFHIPDVSHAGTASEVAFVCGFDIYPLERIDGWMQIKTPTVYLDPYFIVRANTQFSGKVIW
jgi:hypothetical protein